MDRLSRGGAIGCDVSEATEESERSPRDPEQPVRADIAQSDKQTARNCMATSEKMVPQRATGLDVFAHTAAWYQPTCEKFLLRECAEHAHFGLQHMGCVAGRMHRGG